MKVDWGDGVSALDRVLRTATMMVAQVVDKLVSFGHKRDDIQIDWEDDDPTTLVCVKLNGLTMHRIKYVVDDGVSQGLWIQADWVREPKKKGWRKLLFWRQ